MVEPELAFATAKDAADLAELLVREVRQHRSRVHGDCSP